MSPLYRIQIAFDVDFGLELPDVDGFSARVTDVLESWNDGRAPVSEGLRGVLEAAARDQFYDLAREEYGSASRASLEAENATRRLRVRGLGRTAQCTSVTRIEKGEEGDG